MRASVKTLTAAIGITALTIVSMDTYTYAGTGDSLLLGKLNKANKTTHVTSTGDGPALSLHAKGNRPALAVDSNAKIVKLNADRLDGKDAASLQNTVRVYTATSGTSDEYGAISLLLPDIPKGRYLASYSVHMEGPSGTPANPVIASCAFYRTDWDAAAGHTTSSAVIWRPALSGVDILNKGTRRWLLYCAAYESDGPAADWSILPSQPVRVTLTRVDRTIGGAFSAMRSGRAPTS